MSESAATLDDLLATVRRLERKVDDLTRKRERRLLSKRAAARLLGVDRGTTLERYVREGQLRMVDGKIPDTEIDRLLAEGLPPERRQAKRRCPPPGDDAAEIRKVPI